VHRHGGWGNPPPQGPSLRSGLCCPGPSSLNRPHPPHSQAHRDFPAERLIRDAFAVRERRGDPRVVPSFRCPFRPGMPSSLTPGSSVIERVQSLDADTGLRRDLSGSALPTIPQSVSRGARFRGFLGSPSLRPARLLAPLYGSDRARPATGGFYIRACDGSVALTVAGYHYDSHWTPLSAGLSPAGMAASFAAPDPSRMTGRQVSEVALAAGALNRMLELGRPEHVRLV
jgi:hypothetical protein